MQAQLESSLRSSAQNIGVEINDEQLKKLLAFLRQLQRWNKTYNLTAIQSAEEMLVRHIVDSLSVLPQLDTMAQHQGLSQLQLADVGSGGGLPGIVISIMRPAWTVHCVDAVEKKVSFIQQMRAVLDCANLHAIHERIEQLDSLGCDILISRAFSSLGNIIAWAGHHVKPMGYIVAMKGKKPLQELEEIKSLAGWQLEPIVSLDVPQLNEERCLVILEKQG